DAAAPACLLRDRDRVYGQPVRHRVKAWGFARLSPRRTATCAKPHSPASSVVCAQSGLIGPRVACSLSLIHRESARTVHGRHSQDAGRPVSASASHTWGTGLEVTSESDEVLAKHR